MDAFPTPLRAGYRGAAIFAPLCGFLIAAVSKSRCELEGSLRQVAPAFTPFHQGRGVEHADILRRWIWVLRVAHHPIDQSFVERGNPCGGRRTPDRSHEEIGGVLALSADSSRKRLERALTKMRRFLEGRGVMTSDAALGACIAGSALAPQPAGLVHSIVNVAVMSETIGAVPGTTAAGIAKGAREVT